MDSPNFRRMSHQVRQRFFPNMLRKRDKYLIGKSPWYPMWKKHFDAIVK